MAKNLNSVLYFQILGCQLGKIISQNVQICKRYKDIMQNNPLENLDQATIQEIISSVFNKQQQQLDLSNKDYMWKSALSNRDWTSIKQLNLNYCRLHDADISTLISYKWPNLQKLLLSSNSLGTPGIRALLSYSWPSLSSIALNFNQITNEGLQQLITTDKFPKIAQLAFEHNKATSQGFRKCPQSLICQLQHLNLSNSLLGNHGVKYLVKCNLSSIQNLMIYNCDIGDEGACHLMKGNLKNLKKLSVHYNYLNRDGYWYMSQLPSKDTNLVVVKNIDAINLDSFMVSSLGYSASVNYVIISRNHPKKNKGVESMMQSRLTPIK